MGCFVWDGNEMHHAGTGGMVSKGSSRRGSSKTRFATSVVERNSKNIGSCRNNNNNYYYYYYYYYY